MNIVYHVRYILYTQARWKAYCEISEGLSNMNLIELTELYLNDDSFVAENLLTRCDENGFTAEDDTLTEDLYTDCLKLPTGEWDTWDSSHARAVAYAEPFLTSTPV